MTVKSGLNNFMFEYEQNVLGYLGRSMWRFIGSGAGFGEKRFS